MPQEINPVTLLCSGRGHAAKLTKAISDCTHNQRIYRDSASALILVYNEVNCVVLSCTIIQRSLFSTTYDT